MKRSVLILGCASFPEFEDVVEKFNPQVWCINECRPPRIYHRWHQLHSFKFLARAHGEIHEAYFRWLSQLEVPLVLFPREAHSWESYTSSCGEELPRPRIIEYPVDRAIALAGRPYFDTSFAWLTAAAILEGYERIIIGGVTFGKEAEKLWMSRRIAASVVESVITKERKWTEELREGPLVTQKNILNDLRGVLSGDESWAIPCLSYHLGLAQGRGVETIVLGDGNGLFLNKWGDGARYGMDERAGGE